MGLLTAAQIAALPGGKIAHKVEILCPRSPSTFTPVTTHVIHDETAGAPVCVTSFGRRVNSAGNISPKSYGDINSMRCEFTIDNTDGKALREELDTGGIFYSTTGVGMSYMEWPRHCFIKHSRYVLDGSSWSELPGSPWTGQIIDVIYDDKEKSATIQAEAHVSTLMREPWTIDHSHDTLVTSSYTPGGLTISDISTGVEAGGDVWVQFDVSESVSYDITFSYRGVWPGVAIFNDTGSGVTTVESEDTAPPTTPQSWTSVSFHAVLTQTESPNRVQLFMTQTIPYVEFDQTPEARPW
jgi:hypothetical protein